MSDLTFPSNPVVGQTYVAPGGKVWRYGGKGWICLVDSGTQIYYNATPPDDVAKYPLWVNTDTGDLMVFYQDVDSDQWIKIGTTGGGGGTGGGGTGAQYIDDLNDVDTTGVNVNDVLEWDGANWVPTAPAGAGSIDALSDVDTTTSAPISGDVLSWDTANWVPLTLNIANWDTAYTHSQSAHAPTNADNTALNETSHADVVVDGDFTANGFLKRTSLGVYTVDTNTYLTQAQVDARVTAVETSHSDVLVDGDFASAGFMKTDGAGGYSIDATVVVDGDFTANGIMERTGAGTYTTKLNNNSASAAPTTGDDNLDGYSVGSRWYDTTSDKEYVCLDATTAAAVWKETTGSGGSAITVQDEGTPLTTGVTLFNFAGAGVTVTEPTADQMLVTIPGGAGSAVTVVDETTTLTTDVSKLTFTGAGVTATEPVADEVTITIPGGGGGGTGTSSEITCIVRGDNGTDQSLTTGNTLEKVTVFGTPDVDTNSGWDAVNNRYTAPVAGNYAIDWHVLSSGLTSGDNVLTAIYKNGTVYQYSAERNAPSTGIVDIAGGLVMPLDADDYIELWWRAPTTGDLLDADPTSLALSITMVGGIKGESGVTNFKSLTDTPSSFVGKAGSFPVVSPDETSLEFTDVSTTPCAFDANSAGQSTIASGVQQVLFAGVIQEGNSFDTTTSKFTAPEDGWYNFTLSMRMLNVASGSDLYVGLEINDTDTEYKAESTTEAVHATDQTFMVTGSWNIQLTAGDTVHVYTNCTDGSYDIHTDSHFTGHLIQSNINIAPNGIVHAFKVDKSGEGADQDVDTASETKVTWSSSIYEKNVAFDFTNNRFVVPSTGLWHFDVKIRSSGTTAATETVYAAIYVDGVRQDVGTLIRSEGNYAEDSVYNSDIVLEAGQYVEVWFYHQNASGTVSYAANRTWFAGHKVSGTSTGVEYDSYDVGFHVYLTSDDTITSSVYEDIVWDSVSYDNGGNFDTTTGTFICPVDGVYNFSSTLEYLNLTAGDDIYVTINQNSTAHRVALTLDSATRETVSGSITLNCAAGDVIKVRGYCSNSTPDLAGTLGYSHFSGHLVRSATKAESSCNAVLTADQTATISGWNKVNLNSVNSNYGNNFDAVTNNRFDVPENGRYLIDFSVTLSTLTTATTIFVASVHVNGVNTVEGSRHAIHTSNYNISSGSAVLDLAAGDYVELYVYQNESTSETIIAQDNKTYLHVYRLVTSQDIDGAIRTTLPELDDVDETIKPEHNDILIYDDGTQKWKSGNLYNDELSIRVYVDGDITSINGTTDVVYDAVAWSNGGADQHFDTTTGRFTVPVAGRYRISSTFMTQNISSGINCYAWITNGTDSYYTSRMYTDGTGYHTWAGSCTLDCNVGDEIYTRFTTSDTDYLIRGDFPSISVMDIQLTTPSVVIAPHGIEHAIFVKATDSQSVGTSAYTVQFDTIVDQTNLDFDLTNNKFVAPTAGWYEFEFRITATSLSSNARVYSYITRSGLEAIYFEDHHQRSVTGVGRFGGSITCWLNAGTEVTLVVVSTSSFTLRQNTNTESFLAIRKVSGTSTGVEYDSYDISFDAYSTDTTTTYDSTPTLIDYDTVIHDNGGNYDFANSKFIAPVSGTYQFNGTIGITSATDTQRILLRLHKNGSLATTIGEVQATFTSNIVCSGSKDMYLEAGDEIQLYCMIVGGTSKAINGNSNTTIFSGHLIRSTTKAECSFHAVRASGSNQSLTINGWNKINLDDTEFNAGNCYDTTNYKFVAPEDGRYQFNGNAQVQSLNAGETVILTLYKNGARFKDGARAEAAQTAEYINLTLSTILDLVADDEIEFYIYQDASTSEILNGAVNVTHLSGYRLVTSQDTPKKLEDLSNVDNLPPKHNDILKYDEASGEYVPSNFFADPVHFIGTITGGDQNIATTASAWTKIEIDNAARESTGIAGGTYWEKTEANAWTVPETGLYEINLLVQYYNVSVGAAVLMAVGIDDSESQIVVREECDDGSYQMGSGQVLQYLTKGQTISLWISVGDTNYYVRQAATRLEVKLISRDVQAIVAPNGLEHNFMVLAEDGQSFTVTTNNKIAWDTSVYENNVNFDFTNDQFVVPSSGLWNFEARITVTTMSDTQRIYASFVVNGITIYVPDFNQSGAGLARMGGSIQIYCNAGDIVYFNAYNPTTTTTIRQTTGYESFFAGTKIGGTSTGIEYDSYDIAFNVYDATGDSISNVTTEQIILDTVLHDKGGNWDSTNSKFIAPVSGIYMFNGSAQITIADTDVLHTHLYLNETTAFASGSRSPAGATTSQVRSVVSGQIELNAGDSVSLYAYQDSGSAKTCSTGRNNTFLSGHLVKATTKAECSFSAFLNASDNSHTSDAWTPILLNDKHFDYGNNFDTSTGIFTAPENGRYVFTGLARTDSLASGEGFTAGILVDNVIAASGSYDFYGSSSTTASSVNSILDLTAGQEVKLCAWHTGATPETIVGNAVGTVTYLHGYRLVTSQDIARNIDDLDDVNTYTNPPSIGDRLEYNGISWVPAKPTVSKESASFSVIMEDGFEHYYAVDAASVLVTIEKGLPVGHKFSVRCKSTTTFSTTGLTLNLPSGKQLLPVGDNSQISFIVVDTNEIDVSGDLQSV